MYEKFNYNEFVASYLNEFVEEYGTQKSADIAERLSSSNRISSLIKQSENKKVALTTSDILEYLNTIPYFIFSKPEPILIRKKVQ